MQELTLEALLRSGKSEYAKTTANFLVIEVTAGVLEPELIINPKENFEAKMTYYEGAYNDDLTLKAYPSIRITKYALVDKIEDYFTYIY